MANYETAKANQNLLDFDDLIARTRALLSDNEMTQWVLYRVDNGIDHILVDEAQDTSPAQWDIVESLSKEFTDGQGASSVNRTLFVVGDKKQSIFGFQGADPEEFHTKQELFSDRFLKAGKKLENIQLPTSFRSAPPILNLVDQVFSNDTGALGGSPIHEALEETPGRIDLWAFQPKDKAAEKPLWWQPVDTVPSSDPVQKLAIKTAHEIHIVSLLKFLDNELDDLSLAETLRSPIFGLTEGDLFTIAHGRKGTLWQSLRDSPHVAAIEILDDLRKQSDFIRPFELLTRVLNHHGARLNLKARLGDECEDAIDELLAQSVTFETSETPTLGRFLFWLSARDIEIKRDMEAGRNEVRVMTVHGAKGLEAPIVIVPDTSVLKVANKKPPIVRKTG